MSATEEWKEEYEPQEMERSIWAYDKYICAASSRKSEAYQKGCMIRDIQSFSRGGKRLCLTQVQMNWETENKQIQCLVIKKKNKSGHSINHGPD